MSCSVGFLIGNTYANQLVGLLASAVGASAGIGVGSLLSGTTAVLVVTAAAAGVVSGLVGSLGMSAPGFGIMLSIVVAYGQFGASPLPWWQQSLGYLVGAALVATATFAPWIFRRGSAERELVAAVYFAIADMCDVIGTEKARAARLQTITVSLRASTTAGYPAAQAVAFAAAALYALGDPVAPEVAAAVRQAGRQVLAGETVRVCLPVPDDDPGLVAIAEALGGRPQSPPSPRHRRAGAALRSLVTESALANGARLGICMGVATAVTIALHEGPHAFWLPVTVAVIVRPEYASVFVRTVNRVAGTVVGTAAAGVVLWWHPSGLAIAIATALAQGFAMLTAAKHYGLYVAGLTATVLLSSSLGAVDQVAPELRMMDTAIGATIAIVLGYLLWPGARRLPEAARLDAALDATRSYLAEAVKTPEHRNRMQTRQAGAYRLAHSVRTAAQTAMIEPPPVDRLAITIVPAALELEEVVDAITAVAVATTIGQPPEAALVAEVEARLAALQSVAADQEWWPRYSR